MPIPEDIMFPYSILFFVDLCYVEQVLLVRLSWLFIFGWEICLQLHVDEVGGFLSCYLLGKLNDYLTSNYMDYFIIDKIIYKMGGKYLVGFLRNEETYFLQYLSP
jgi:hypothetical protein